MTSFTLSVVAPDRTVFEDKVTSAIVPAIFGYMGIRAGHEAMLVALKAGVISYTDTINQTYYVSVSGGFLEVSGKSAIILAQDAVRSSEVDIAAAQAMLDEARRALRGEASELTTPQAVEEIEKANARIQAARRG